MTVTTKPSPVGEDLQKQAPPTQPPVINPDGSAFVTTSVDNVLPPVSEPAEQQNVEGETNEYVLECSDLLILNEG